uniref:Uncharacterized protein n=1 Tax=Avena sativa TaxID=4498 RepID=A0ACD5VIL5_AVESA
MENPLAAVVINNLPHLLDNPDLAQRLLDDARADLHLNGVLLVEAAAHLRECLAYQAELRSFPDATEDQRTECAVHVAVAMVSCDFFLKQHRLLAQLVGSLLVVRAAATAMSRAHLIPGVLLTAVAAAVVVYVCTWGGVVPGLRSFVRLSVLMLGFLFASDRPPRGGG